MSQSWCIAVHAKHTGLISSPCSCTCTCRQTHGDLDAGFKIKHRKVMAVSVQHLKCQLSTCLYCSLFLFEPFEEYPFEKSTVPVVCAKESRAKRTAPKQYHFESNERVYQIIKNNRSVVFILRAMKEGNQTQ
ncbi:hypothetical protein AMECASPLE_000714 [Ameca splendens]|uniref:Uncharacterized protein n=1 Tax=Ameca splendens TaxID=208324 RepID=A0ABV0X9Q5_9TELE